MDAALALLDAMAAATGLRIRPEDRAAAAQSLAAFALHAEDLASVPGLGAEKLASVYCPDMAEGGEE